MLYTVRKKWLMGFTGWQMCPAIQDRCMMSHKLTYAL